MKKILFFIFLLSLYSCQSEGNCKKLDKETCPTLKNFTVFGKNDVLHFDHLCSEMQPGLNFREAYAFFEQQSSKNNFKALALGQVQVGWYGVQKKIVGLSLEKLHLQSLKGWENDYFALAVKTKNTRSHREASGNFSEHFLYSISPGGAGFQNIKYQMSETGSFEWERFSEKRTGVKTVYKDSKDLHVNAVQLDSLKDEQQIYLMIKNKRTGAVFDLKGPTLKNLESLLDIKKPEVRELNFLEALNPFDEAGIVGFYINSYRYRNCIYLRKRAKKEFIERFRFINL